MNEANKRDGKISYSFNFFFFEPEGPAIEG